MRIIRYAVLSMFRQKTLLPVALSGLSGLVAFLMLALLGAHRPAASTPLSERAITTAAGERQVDRGTIAVPWFHEHPGKGTFELPILRLRTAAARPSPPVFLLAGGPGNTYLDDLRNEARFNSWLDAMLEQSDVVLVEQRGADTSGTPLTCMVQANLALSEPLHEDRYTALIADSILECQERFAAKDVPLAAFDILQMAADIDHVADALGYETINLMGGSFGSQLGLTVMREHPARVHRAVFYGVEGPNHTLDDPALVAGHLQRVADAVASSWQMRLLLGDFNQALETRLAQLNQDPIRSNVDGFGTVAFGAYDLKVMLWSSDGLKGYRDGIRTAARLLAALKIGRHFEVLTARAQLVDRVRTGGLSLNLMSFLVDCASAGTDVPANDEAFIFGPEIVDADLRATCAALNVPTLPPHKRAIPQSEHPVLLLASTLDGFTPPTYARDVAAELPRSHLVEVVRGDHDGWQALASIPSGREKTLRFLAGDSEAHIFPKRVVRPQLNIELLPSEWLVGGIMTAIAGLAGAFLYRRRPYRSHE